MTDEPHDAEWWADAANSIARTSRRFTLWALAYATIGVVLSLLDIEALPAWTFIPGTVVFATLAAIGAWAHPRAVAHARLRTWDDRDPMQGGPGG